MDIQKEKELEKENPRRPWIITLLLGLGLIIVNYMFIIFADSVSLWLMMLMPALIFIGLAGAISPKIAKSKVAGSIIGVAGVLVGVVLFYYLTY